MKTYPNPTLHNGPDGLRFEDVSLVALAGQYGTPTYVYSREALTSAFNAYQSALKGHRAQVFYAAPHGG